MQCGIRDNVKVFKKEDIFFKQKMIEYDCSLSLRLGV